MKEKEQKKDLYIPLPVPEEKEFVSGIGNREIRYIGFCIFFDLVFCISLHIFSQSLMIDFIVFIIFLFAGFIFFIKRDAFNDNGLDKIRVYFAFQKAQKKYAYEYHNEIKCIEHRNEDE